jgi:hypothetical protein
VTPNGAVSVACGSDQAFSFSADNCYSIVDVLVDGTSVGPVSSYTFTNVQASHTITGWFVNGALSINASAGTGGSISPSGNVSVGCGSDQNFMITADGCHTIADVTVDGSSVGAVGGYLFTNVQGSHTIAATFATIIYTVTASAGAGGSISPNGGTAVGCGSDLAVTITPDAGYSVAAVMVDGSGVGAVTTTPSTTSRRTTRSRRRSAIRTARRSRSRRRTAASS